MTKKRDKEEFTYPVPEDKCLVERVPENDRCETPGEYCVGTNKDKGGKEEDNQ